MGEKKSAEKILKNVPEKNFEKKFGKMFPEVNMTSGIK